MFLICQGKKCPFQSEDVFLNTNLQALPASFL